LLFLHLKDTRNQLILFWLLGLAVTVGFSESAPAAQRYVAAAPALALMVAFSLKQFGDLLTHITPRRQRWIETSLLVLVALLAADDARFYFQNYTHNNDFGGFNTQVAQRLADRMRQELPGVDLVFCGYPYMGYDSIATLPYLAPAVHYYNVKDAWGSPDTPVPPGDHIFFAFLPDHDSDRQAVAEAYPGGAWSEEFTSSGHPLYWLYDYMRPPGT